MSQPLQGPIWFDPMAFYLALDVERRLRNITWVTIAAEAGVSPSTLTRIGLLGHPSADSLVRLMAWLGETDLSPYMRTGTGD